MMTHGLRTTNYLALDVIKEVLEIEHQISDPDFPITDETTLKRYIPIVEEKLNILFSLKRGDSVWVDDQDLLLCSDLYLVSKLFLVAYVLQIRFDAPIHNVRLQTIHGDMVVTANW